MRYLPPLAFIIAACLLASHLSQACTGYIGPTERLGGQVMAGCE